jgi:hypothetical protein
MIDGAIKLIYTPQINSESQERINSIKEFLKNNPEYNFIIYINHISLNDPALAYHLAEKITPKDQFRHLLIPISYSHTEKSSTEGKIINSLTKFINKFEVETIRVIQNYQVNNPEYGYTEDEAKTTHFQFLKRVQELKKKNISTGILISPEGHRSEDAQLAEGQAGLIGAGRILAPVIYVPLAISYPKNFKRNSINLGKKMNMDVGEIVQQKNSREFPTIEELMQKLANALPEEMRGIWQ